MLFQKYALLKEAKSLLSSPDKREMINKKFSYLIARGELLEKFTPEEVFNYYTGKGGLHGLKRADFRSFHEYTEAKKEIEQGAFFTPDAFLEKIHSMIRIEESHFVADLSFGKGGFFNYCPNENNIYGCEIDPLSANIASLLFPKGNLVQGDYRLYSPEQRCDVVFGNPPFNLRFSYKKELGALSQMVYVDKAAEILKEGGLLVLLVPASFLADEFSNKYEREEVDKHFSLIAQTKLEKDLFKEAGVEAFDTKLMFLKRDSSEEKSNDYDRFVDIENDEVFYERYIKPIMDDMKNAAVKLHNMRARAEKSGFDFKVTKLLFDIKRQPSTKEYYAKCLAYYNKYKTQKCPEGMKYEEWVKHHRISEKQVISSLKRYLQKHNPKKPHKKGDIVKTDHEIVLYTSAVSKERVSINNVVWYDQMHLAQVTPYEKLMRKKRKAFELQTTPFDEMAIDPKIQSFLESAPLVNDDMEPVKLNEIQLQDTNRILQKRYGYNQWDMGTGKTLTGMAQIKYRLAQKQIDKVFVIGPAIAIDGTWNDALRKNDIKAVNVKSLKDLERAIGKDNDVIMLSHYYLGKYYKVLKKIIKQHKIFLLVDEADEYSNPSSIRTKRALSLFRRVAYKTLMSGTSVRNNIVEFYPQLEILYNNSVNMMDETPYRYWINTKKKDGEIGELKFKLNPNRFKPFPAWRGFSIYKGAFNPSKVTVFGAKKQDQKIYNHEILSKLLDYTVITRSFKEVTGRDIHKIHQEFVEPNEQELALEEKIKREIHAFYGEHIHKTGNDRKDAMLRLLHQMNLLFKACALPVAFKEYTLDTMSKYEHIKKCLDGTDRYLAIGGMHIEEMLVYKRWIERDYPQKRVFYIDGSINIKQRKKIVREMKEMPNSVLISTIGSLKSSLNINFIDDILAVSLPWNFSQLDQWQKRFVRYDSMNFKNIRYVTLAGTIESNLIKLIVDKDSLVSFMKTKELGSSTQLNVDLEMLLSLVVEKEELKKQNKEEAA